MQWGQGSCTVSDRVCLGSSCCYSGRCLLQPLSASVVVWPTDRQPPVRNHGTWHRDDRLGRVAPPICGNAVDCVWRLGQQRIAMGYGLRTCGVGRDRSWGFSCECLLICGYGLVVLYFRIFLNMADKTHPFTV